MPPILDVALPTAYDLLGRVLTATPFRTEAAGADANTLRISAEIAAQLAAEAWETEAGVPVGETVPLELTARVAGTLVQVGVRAAPWVGEDMPF